MRWQSGHAADCNPAHAGSTPARMSNLSASVGSLVILAGLEPDARWFKSSLADQHRGKMQYTLVKPGLVAAMSYKAGSRALHSALKGVCERERISQEEVHSLRGDADAEVILFFRDPWERLASAWSYLSQNGRKWDFPTFVEEFLVPADRWQPFLGTQLDTHTHDGLFLPTQVYPLERMNDMSMDLFGVQTEAGVNSRARKNTAAEMVAALPTMLATIVADRYGADAYYYERLNAALTE